MTGTTLRISAEDSAVTASGADLNAEAAFEQLSGKRSAVLAAVHAAAAAAASGLVSDDELVAAARASRGTVETRRRKASRPLTAPAAAALAADVEPSVRAAVAENRTAPQQVRAALAADPNAEVRARLPLNAAVTLDELRALVKDEDPTVRLYVAAVSVVADFDGLLDVLAADSSAAVRAMAGRRSR